MTVTPAMLEKLDKYSRPEYSKPEYSIPEHWSIKSVEIAEFSGSALADDAWKHNHCIDWANACIFGVESRGFPGKSSTLVDKELQSIGIKGLCQMHMIVPQSKLFLADFNSCFYAF